MQIVKKTTDYTIIKKRSGRFGVRNKHNVWVNGQEKTDILQKAGLVKAKTESKPEVEVEADKVEADETSSEAQA